MKTPTTPKPKRVYEKPRVRSIKLAADEVLAKGCKMATPSAGFLNTGCLAGGCFNNGS